MTAPPFEIVILILTAMFASLIFNFFIVLTERWHGRLSLDSNMTAVQKFHKKPVPRVGGIGLMMGILAAIFVGFHDASNEVSQEGAHNLFKLLIAAMPALMIGVLEDITKTVSVKARLLATFTSALMSCWLLGAYLTRVDLWGFDTLLQVVPFAMVFTAFAVAGVANAINIIDGFNGLASCTSILILSALSFVAWQSGDALVAQLAIVGAAATIGFLLINYPTGRIFLGDGGAYLLGFWIAEIAVLIIIRNPEVNAWQVLSICSYPIIEVVFSMYRRKVVRKASVGDPDKLHLHSLIYRRMVCQFIPRNDAKPWIRNATVAFIVVAYLLPFTLAAVLFGKTIVAALAILALQIFSYMAFYSRLVRGHWCFNPVVIFGFRKSTAQIKPTYRA